MFKSLMKFFGRKIDSNTLARFIVSGCPIHQLIYYNASLVNNPDDSQHIDLPAWIKSCPLIVPANDIPSFSDFAFKDLRWYVLTGDQIPIFPPEVLFIVFDFKINNDHRALSFAFTYSDTTVEWLRDVLKVQKVSIASGPSNRGFPIALDVDSRLFSIIEKWIASFPQTGKSSP